MATFTKEFLSGSTNGRPVKVTATATAGTIIHTAHATAKDEIWLFANNTDTVNRKITIEFGGVTAPDDLIELTIPAESGLVQIIPGLIQSNSQVVRVFAETTNVINITGFVNRIT
jgi:hypothetical protein